MLENGLMRKLRLISKFMMSETGKLIIAIHILPNFSRRKGDQTMKFGQLKEYNTRNFFLKKSYTKNGEETSPRPFLKKKQN